MSDKAGSYEDYSASLQYMECSDPLRYRGEVAWVCLRWTTDDDMEHMQERKRVGAIEPLK